jgi:hypothetical protein
MPSKSLPLRFPLLQSLSFERAAAIESSDLLLLLVTQQPELLSHLQELDLSSCKVSIGARLAMALLVPIWLAVAPVPLAAVAWSFSCINSSGLHQSTTGSSEPAAIGAKF